MIWLALGARMRGTVVALGDAADKVFTSGAVKYGMDVLGVE